MSLACIGLTDAASRAPVFCNLVEPVWASVLCGWPTAAIFIDDYSVEFCECHGSSGTEIDKCEWSSVMTIEPSIYECIALSCCMVLPLLEAADDSTVTGLNVPYDVL